MPWLERKRRRQPASSVFALFDRRLTGARLLILMLVSRARCTMIELRISLTIGSLRPSIDARRNQNALTVHERLTVSKLLAFFFAACWPMVAQTNFATLSGRVQDPAQAPVPAARVSVTAKATGAARQTTTNSEGLFEAPNLAPGEYRLRRKAPRGAGPQHENTFS